MANQRQRRTARPRPEWTARRPTGAGGPFRTDPRPMGRVDHGRLDAVRDRQPVLGANGGSPRQPAGGHPGAGRLHRQLHADRAHFVVFRRSWPAHPGAARRPARCPGDLRLERVRHGSGLPAMGGGARCPGSKRPGPRRGTRHGQRGTQHRAPAGPAGRRRQPDIVGLCAVRDDAAGRPAGVAVGSRYRQPDRRTCRSSAERPAARTAQWCLSDPGAAAGDVGVADAARPAGRATSRAADLRRAGQPPDGTAAVARRRRRAAGPARRDSQPASRLAGPAGHRRAGDDRRLRPTGAGPRPATLRGGGRRRRHRRGTRRARLHRRGGRSSGPGRQRRLPGDGPHPGLRRRHAVGRQPLVRIPAAACAGRRRRAARPGAAGPIPDDPDRVPHRARRSR